MKRPARTDDGFTLVELLVAIVILGVVMSALVAIVMTYLTDTNITQARFVETHDAQISSSYFAQDVASVGVRDISASPFAETPSMDQSNAPGYPYACSTAGTTPVLRMAWNYYTYDATTSKWITNQVRVAYVVDGTGTTLTRLVCNGVATPGTSTVMAQHLDPASPPVVTCSTSCSWGVTATPVVPATVTLRLTIKSTDHTGGPFVVALTGHPRQAS